METRRQSPLPRPWKRLRFGARTGKSVSGAGITPCMWARAVIFRRSANGAWWPSPRLKRAGAARQGAIEVTGSRMSWWSLALIIAAVLAADQATKHAIEHYTTPDYFRVVIPGLLN